MVQAIGAIGGHKSPLMDPEYMKILQELRELGLTPTGDKNIDKARVETEKQKLAQKIEEKMETKQPENSGEMAQRASMEVQKIGAMNVAELNKILHKLV